MQNKNPMEVILHVGLVISLQSWVAKKSCHGQTLINECSIFDYPSSFEGLNSPYMQYYFKRFFFGFAFLRSNIFILGQNARQKAIEIEIAFFSPPFGIPRVAHWIISFMLHISAITSPTN